MVAPRLLTIMGSGETTATMVSVHRSVLERFPARPLVAVLDTPYGFQENADELTARALDYFRTSLPMARVEEASLRSLAAPASSREQALDILRRADVVFSGPGSPTYARRVWAGTPVAAILKGKLRHGALTMASAASITLGRFALPVYEVYKVGADPAWLGGLDILGEAGIAAVVVPHWNNAEGGTHDTSRCWLGARRFEALAAQLPAGIAVLGVDEHTAALLDLGAGRLEVAGKGTVTWRSAGRSAVLGPGDAMPLPVGATSAAAPEGEAGPLGVTTRPDIYEAAFEAAIEERDSRAALDAILSLEDAHEAWEGPAAATAHDTLRAMATRFATAMAGAARYETARAGAVEVLLEVRARARDEGRWADADAIRRALHLLAVEIRDTPEGPKWEPASS
jgi:hypothetical protein